MLASMNSAKQTSHKLNAYIIHDKKTSGISCRLREVYRRATYISLCLYSQGIQKSQCIDIKCTKTVISVLSVIFTLYKM